jgi:prepilin-type N-terminal cleavage/methylation domain-containing protein
MKSFAPRKLSGFTLIELVLVLTIIIILVGRSAGRDASLIHLIHILG